MPHLQNFGTVRLPDPERIQSLTNDLNAHCLSSLTHPNPTCPSELLHLASSPIPMRGKCEQINWPNQGTYVRGGSLAAMLTINSDGFLGQFLNPWQDVP
jgi:hypothetical protein